MHPIDPPDRRWWPVSGAWVGGREQKGATRRQLLILAIYSVLQASNLRFEHLQIRFGHLQTSQARFEHSQAFQIPFEHLQTFQTSV